MIERSMRPFCCCAAVFAILCVVATCSTPQVIAAEERHLETPKIGEPASEVENPEEVQQIIDKIRQVISPQQKELARELIR